MNEAQWLEDAAKGDVGAQTALAHFCIANVASGVPAGEALAMAEPFARLAAQHGGAMELLLLADVLSMRAVELRKAGHDDRADAHRESAFALYDQVATCGDTETIAALVACLTGLADRDEAAADRLNKIVAGMSAERARTITRAAKRRLRETEGYWVELAKIAAE
jgi:hypothetical protein